MEKKRPRLQVEAVGLGLLTPGGYFVLYRSATPAVTYL